MNDKKLEIGMTVRVKDANRYISSFAKKIADRDAIVEVVGPTSFDMFKGKARIRFLKRNGRGKEFSEWMRFSELVIVEQP